MITNLNKIFDLEHLQYSFATVILYCYFIHSKQETNPKRMNKNNVIPK